VLHRGSIGGPSRAIAYLSDRAKSQDALVRTSPERDGVAQVLWCADLSCSTDGPGPLMFDIPNCGRFLGWGVIEGMIEVLMMDRQYSLQKKFRFCVRNIRKSRRELASCLASPGALLIGVAARQAPGGRRCL
jgi:hypothetical protein